MNKKDFATAANVLNKHPDLLEQMTTTLAFMNNNISFLLYLFKNQNNIRANKDLANKLILNETFVSYLSGYPIKIMLRNQLGSLEEQITQLSTEELMSYFKRALVGGYKKMIQAFWSNYPLASYLTGNLTTILVRNQQGNLEEKITQASTEELIHFFNLVVKRRPGNTIKKLWNNKMLASYLSGYSTTILVRNTEGNLEEQTRQLSPKELLDNFETLLSTNCTEVIKEVMGNANSPLRTTIKEIDNPQVKIKLTQRALLCVSQVSTALLKNFLNLMPKVILQDCLKKLEESTSTPSTALQNNRINLLTEVINEYTDSIPLAIETNQQNSLLTAFPYTNNPNNFFNSRIIKSRPQFRVNESPGCELSSHDIKMLNNF